MGVTGKVGSIFFFWRGRGEECNFSGDIFGIAVGTIIGTIGDSVGYTKYKPFNLISAKNKPNDETKETGNLGGSYWGTLGGALLGIGGGPK